MKQQMTEPIKIHVPEVSRFDKLMQRISISVILFAALIALYYFFLTFVNSPEPVVFTQPIRVLHTHMKVGDPLTLVLTYCKSQNASSLETGQIQYDDHIIFALPNVTQELQLGCHTVNYVWGIIPADIPEGTYTIKFRSTYQVNPLHTEVFTHETLPFTIDN